LAGADSAGTNVLRSRARAARTVASVVAALDARTLGRAVADSIGAEVLGARADAAGTAAAVVAAFLARAIGNALAKIVEAHLLAGAQTAHSPAAVRPAVLAGAVIRGVAAGAVVAYSGAVAGDAVGLDGPAVLVGSCRALLTGNLEVQVSVVIAHAPDEAVSRVDVERAGSVHTSIAGAGQEILAASAQVSAPVLAAYLTETIGDAGAKSG